MERLRALALESAIEVKRLGPQYRRSGQVFVEFAALRHGVWASSGVYASTADRYAFVSGGAQDAVIFVDRKRLAAYCREHEHCAIVGGELGSHPTRGILVSVGELWLLGAGGELVGEAGRWDRRA